MNKEKVKIDKTGRQKRSHKICEAMTDIDRLSRSIAQEDFPDVLEKVKTLLALHTEFGKPREPYTINCGLGQYGYMIRQQLFDVLDRKDMQLAYTQDFMLDTPIYYLTVTVL